MLGGSPLLAMFMVTFFTVLIVYPNIYGNQIYLPQRKTHSETMFCQMNIQSFDSNMTQPTNPMTAMAAMAAMAPASAAANACTAARLSRVSAEVR